MSDQPRKTPKQMRARATVDAILTATAHILQAEGARAATTNRIAQRAGVSIGSLYQYFPNKQAVLSALRDQRASAYDRRVRARLAERTSGNSRRDAARKVIGEVIAMHRADGALHNALAEGHRALDPEAEAEFRGILRASLEEHAGELRPMDAQLVSFIAIRAMEALIHGTALDAPEMFDHPGFADEVAELLVRFIEP